MLDYTIQNEGGRFNAVVYSRPFGSGEREHVATFRQYLSKALADNAARDFIRKQGQEALAWRDE